MLWNSHGIQVDSSYTQHMMHRFLYFLKQVDITISMHRILRKCLIFKNCSCTWVDVAYREILVDEIVCVCYSIQFFNLFH
jgi:hypothetical protein